VKLGVGILALTDEEANSLICYAIGVRWRPLQSSGICMFRIWEA